MCEFVCCIAQHRIGLPYFELLLWDTAGVRVQKLQDMGDQISAAEIVGPQCREQHILSPGAYLEGDKEKSQLDYYILSNVFVMYDV